MEQRRLRLGDILDDYCPRERRVTNHAIVAMVDEDVKQTRCTTCDAEHAYKGGKAPRRRKKETPATLYKEVLESMPDSEGAMLVSTPAAITDATDAESTTVTPDDDTLHAAASPPEISDDVQSEPESSEPVSASDSPSTLDASESSLAADTEPEDNARPLTAAEDGPVHRPLIRATLPRPEGQKDTRPLPEFTIRHAGARNNGNFRGDQRMKPRGGQGPNGSRGQRFGASRPGSAGRGLPGRGQSGGGFRASQPTRRGGKKRSR